MSDSFVNTLVNIVDVVYANKQYFTTILILCFMSILYFGFFPLTVKDGSPKKEYIIVFIRKMTIIILFGLMPFAFLLVYMITVKLTGNSDFFMKFINETVYGFHGAWALYLSIIIGTFTLKIFIERVVEPYYSNLVRKFRVRQSSEKVSDIREEIKTVKTKRFDATKYFKDDYMFLGLDSNNRPIYEKDEDFKKRNLKIIGPSQTGKGVVQGVIIYQSILKGWITGFFDIKPDDFIYSIMVKACKEAGREPPIVVDLNGVGTGSYNMFENGTQREIISRLQTALNINETGTNADFYNANERSLLLDIIQFFKSDLSDFYQLLCGKLPNGKFKKEYFEITQKSRAYVKEMMGHKPLNPKKGSGFNIDKTLSNNRVFYIRGSVTDKLVRKAQTIMLMDVIQSVLRNGKQEKHFYLAIDEVKFLVSDMLSTGLSTVLSKGMNISVAYQTLNNLLNLEDATLNAKAIKSEIEVNTLTTISYRAGDDETAEWAAALTGTRNKTIVRSEEVDYGKMGAETYTGRKQVHQDQEELIPKNKMLSFPPMVAALIRPNILAQVLYTSWIKLDPSEIVEIPLKKQVAKKPKVKATKKPTVNDEINDDIIIDDDYSKDDFLRQAGIKSE